MMNLLRDLMNGWNKIRKSVIKLIKGKQSKTSKYKISIVVNILKLAFCI